MYVVLEINKENKMIKKNRMFDKGKKIILIAMVLSTTLVAEYNRFIRDDNKKIVIDHATGLIWEDNGGYKSKNLYWSQAIDYCNNLTLGSYDDWRLPNINELRSIVDYDTKRSVKANSIFKSFNYDSSLRCWSSTSENSAFAWIIMFGSGTQTFEHGFKTFFQNQARCVRSGK